MFATKELRKGPASKRLPAMVSVWAALLAVLLTVGACGGGEEPAATTPAVTVETGGMSLGDAAAEGTPASGEESAAASATLEAPAPAVEAPVLDAGAVITAPGRVAIYADADPAAARFGQYEAGTVLTVLEAGGGYTAYPVVVDDRRWYRVRAPDGLVGWVSEP